MFRIRIDKHPYSEYYRQAVPLKGECPREDAGGLSREYILRIPSVS